jgi:hypothetical protein
MIISVLQVSGNKPGERKKETCRRERGTEVSPPSMILPVSMATQGEESESCKIACFHLSFVSLTVQCYRPLPLSLQFDKMSVYYDL